jgi:hypothetical protein
VAVKVSACAFFRTIADQPCFRINGHIRHKARMSNKTRVWTFKFTLFDANTFTSYSSYISGLLMHTEVTLTK